MYCEKNAVRTSELSSSRVIKPICNTWRARLNNKVLRGLQAEVRKNPEVDLTTLLSPYSKMLESNGKGNTIRLHSSYLC